MKPLKFAEEPVPTESKHYKVIRIYQSVEWSKDPKKASRDDFFNHVAYREIEERLSKIACPLRGTRKAEDVPDVEIVKKPGLVDMEFSLGIDDAPKT